MTAEIVPSTSGKYQKVYASLIDSSDNIMNNLSDYKTQAIDNYTTTDVIYICKMKADGTWLFIKIDKTGNFPTFTYANVSNNATLTTYALAYAARTTATYGLLNTLTL